MDSVLKLYTGCPLMLTENNDVPRGQANGSSVRLRQIRTKPGELPTYVTLSSGVKVPAYRASQIDSLRVEHLNGLRGYVLLCLI